MQSTSTWSVLPWSRRLKAAPGTLITQQVRLLRPMAEVEAGNVWVADHLALARQVAVTFAAPLGEGSSAEANAVSQVAVAEGFARQARANATIADPHLVQVLEHGDVKGVAFMVAELLEGQSLRKYLQDRGALTLSEIQAVVTQAAGVLGRAHALGIAHGGLRPENLFLAAAAADPFVKVGGFCREAELMSGASALAAGSALHAKLPYASPEQLLLGAGNDAASDLWALAVATYELLTTILPFEAATPAGVTVAICNAQFSLPSHYRGDLAGSVDAWFARALAKAPADRFRSASDFAEAFALALRGTDASSARAADTSADEDDDDDDVEEEEEKTVKWDLPTDWVPGISSGPPARVGSSQPVLPPLPALSGHLREPLPPPAAGRVPEWQAAPSLTLSPAAVSRTALPGVAMSSPGGRPTAGLMQSPHLASVASAALAPPNTLSAFESANSSARRQRERPGKLLLTGGLLISVGAVTWWLYQSQGPVAEGIDGESRTARAASIATLTVDDLPELDPSVGSEDTDDRRPLPAILKTHQLPAAPDEAGEAAELDEAAGTNAAPAMNGAAVHAAGARSALSHAESAPKASAPAAPAPVAKHAPAAPLAAARSKPSDASGNCNPPYYFDANDIRRIKRECLEGSAKGMGKELASIMQAPVMRASGTQASGTQAKAPPVPPTSKPAPAKHARAGASCSPPYFFDQNNIRRLKLECL